ncbi:hypothetical protein HAX54_008650 [Datura stramonium]|uniref:Uncharacterized protein n=1 Tax=Datura stramonium TaxID=4076 RepID=A0ABS8TEI4_DATST|nr:hypothetical protein [Datura stramonium]
MVRMGGGVVGTKSAVVLVFRLEKMEGFGFGGAPSGKVHMVVLTGSYGGYEVADAPPLAGARPPIALTEVQDQQAMKRLIGQCNKCGMKAWQGTLFTSVV